MANYKATWLRKKLLADGKFLGHRLLELCTIIPPRGSIPQEDAFQFDKDLGLFVEDITLWIGNMRKEIASRVEVEAEAAE